MLPPLFFPMIRTRGVGAALALPILLAGCAAIPASGPTGGEIRSQVKADTSHLGIALVPVTNVADLPKPVVAAPVFAPDYTPPAPTELVGVGDVLDIAIYESGIAVFGRSAPAVAAGEANFDTAAKAERLPPTRVSDEGAINIPYVGELAVKGRTTADVEKLVRQALRGKSQNPQVLVSIREGLTNSVIVGGDVARPGRLVLPTNRESLTDVIALAGGNRGEMKDMAVRVQRAGVTGDFRLSEIMADPAQDIRIFPADRIALLRKGFDAAIKDAQFVAEAAKADLPLVGSLDGASSAKIIDEIYNAPPRLIEKAKETVR